MIKAFLFGIWYDNWHPMGHLLMRHGARAARLSGLPIDSKLSAIISGSSWYWPDVRERATTIMEIKSELHTIITHGCAGSPKWILLDCSRIISVINLGLI